MHTLDKRDITDYAAQRWNLSGGMTVHLYSVYDEMTTPSDYGVGPTDDHPYRPHQDEAWRRGEWEYIGLVVEVYSGEIKIAESAVFGFESGRFPTDQGEDQYLDPINDENCFADVMDEALFEASSTLARLQGLSISSK
jgi:hypothetical protein